MNACPNLSTEGHLPSQRSRNVSLKAHEALEVGVLLISLPLNMHTQAGALQREQEWAVLLLSYPT